MTSTFLNGRRPQVLKMEYNINIFFNGIRSQFLAVIAALYLTMSVGRSVGRLVGWSVRRNEFQKA
jgi:hypothetical protein